MESIINQFVNSLPFELHLVDPIVGKYSACGPGTKHKERIKKFLETKDVTNLYKNDLDKACFLHDSGYSKFKDVEGRRPYDKKLIEDSKKIINSNLDGFQRGYASMINKFFSKKIGGELSRREINTLKKTHYNPLTGYSSMNELHRRTGIPTSKIKEWLETQDTYTKHKPIVRKFKRRKVITGGVNHQWQADLVELQEFAKVNDGYRYLLTVIDIFSKYAWAIPIKNKTGNEVTKAFEKIFNINGGPLAIQSDKGVEFLNKKTQNLFKSKNIKSFVTENETKAQIVERFNRTLKNRMYKYFTANNTRRWIDVIDQLVENYNNSYHRSIKMTPKEALQDEGTVRNNLYGFDHDREDVHQNDQGLKVGDKVRIYKYKGTFSRGFKPNFTNEIFTITEVLETNPPTYRIKDSNGEDIIGSFYAEELSRQNFSNI